MAFAKSKSTSSVASVPAAGQFEQALGFVNLSLPNAEGSLVKFAVAALKGSNAAEQMLFDDLCDADQEAAVLEWIKENIVLTFRKNKSGAAAPSFGYKKAA